MSNNGEVDEFGIQNGWIYKRTSKSHIYYFVALMNDECDPAYQDRNYIEKHSGKRNLKRDYDMDFINNVGGFCDPPVEITESKAKKIVTEWKKQSKALW